MKYISIIIATRIIKIAADIRDMPGIISGNTRYSFNPYTKARQ